MARNTSVSLSPHFTEFIDALVETGRYATASEVVRASLRLLQSEEARLADLRDALVEGETSGEEGELNLGQFLERQRTAKAS